MRVILDSEITPQTQIIREQIIGEARAYKTCAAYPEKIHKEIVKLKQKKEYERLENKDIL